VKIPGKERTFKNTIQALADDPYVIILTCVYLLTFYKMADMSSVYFPSQVSPVKEYVCNNSLESTYKSIEFETLLSKLERNWKIFQLNNVLEKIYTKLY
jgi:hypothetical protein